MLKKLINAKFYSVDSFFGTSIFAKLSGICVHTSGASGEWSVIQVQIDRLQV